MTHTTIRPDDVVRNLTAHPLRILIPVVVLTFLSAAYAVIRPTTWEAVQALVVRDEAGDRLTRPGKFAHADEMKTSQETILELAKSRNVLAKALAEVGPPSGFSATTPWPGEKDIEGLQGSVKISPPKGAEFGKTEVFYLKVQNENQQRAVELAAAVSRQLQHRFAELRESKARSTTDELTKTASLAQADLAIATNALSKMEQQAGSDLAELRILNESPSGDSDLRRTATEVEKEVRAYRATQTEGEEFLKILAAVQQDPNKLLATPSVLLRAQPALGRLKDGLVDSQLRTGQALGTVSELHPLARNARAAEKAIRDQLHDEIGLAMQGVEADLRVNADRIRTLEEQDATIQARLARLAASRADYANLVTSSKSRAETLKAIEHDLAEARAGQSAVGTSLINLIDTPDAGSRPIGPGRTTILAGGFGTGLLLALAIVFLTVTPGEVDPGQSRRHFSVPVGQIEHSVNSLSLKQALQRVTGNRI